MAHNQYVTVFFLLLALVLFLLAAFLQPEPPRLRWIAGGLAAYMLSLLAGVLLHQ